MSTITKAAKVLDKLNQINEATDQTFDVYAKRNGIWGTKWNTKPLSSKDAEKLMSDIKKAGIPSVTEVEMVSTKVSNPYKGK